jgi:hypothetical protein
MIVALVTAKGEQNVQRWQPARRLSVKVKVVEAYAPDMPRHHWHDIPICTWACLTIYFWRWFFSIGPAWHWEIL